ncbi:MAG: ATP-binding cassette domain-containing protein [Christensenellales bacterium]|jgi:ABC-2 type transport system ATP-binding protein
MAQEEHGAYVRVQAVSKSFGDAQVLHAISVDFERGKIHGLIGKNGSGKTVLLKCICGLLRPTQGAILVDGKQVGKDMDFPQSMGMIIESPGFLPYYSGRRNLEILASLRRKIGKAQIAQVMQQVGLDPNNRKGVGKYSMGMRQRLGIAQAVMEDPDLLILDEPMNGLDKQGIAWARAFFAQLRDQGKTLIMASHSAEDVATLCDTVHEMEGGVLTEVAPQM